MALYSYLVAFLLVEIVDLPGLSFKPDFKHYSGYLNASKTRFLHYW